MSQRTQESRNLAGDLAEIAARMGQLKGDASTYLTDPNCSTLGLRLQNAYAAAEAAAVGAGGRVRLAPSSVRSSSPRVRSRASS